MPKQAIEIILAEKQKIPIPYNLIAPPFSLYLTMEGGVCRN